jgi:hypothetical protein
MSRGHPHVTDNPAPAPICHFIIIVIINVVPE